MIVSDDHRHLEWSVYFQESHDTGGLWVSSLTAAATASAATASAAAAAAAVIARGRNFTETRKLPNPDLSGET